MPVRVGTKSANMPARTCICKRDHAHVHVHTLKRSCPRECTCEPTYIFTRSRDVSTFVCTHERNHGSLSRIHPHIGTIMPKLMCAHKGTIMVTRMCAHKVRSCEHVHVPIDVIMHTVFTRIGAIKLALIFTHRRNHAARVCTHRRDHASTELKK